MRDERCVMVNLDPDTAEKDSEVMKTVVRMNDNYAGVYSTVIKARRASCRSSFDTAHFLKTAQLI